MDDTWLTAEVHVHFDEFWKMPSQLGKGWWEI